MKTTIKKLIEFANVGGSYLAKEKKDKLSYAIEKVSKRSLKRIFEDHNDRIADIEIDLCSVDEKGNILKDEKGNLCYTKENLKKKRDQLKKLLDYEVDIEPHVVEGTDGLTDEEIDAFYGIVLKPLTVES